MKSVEEYAADLVADGAESHAEDDMNEDGAIAEENHEAACDLAISIAMAVRRDPAGAVEFARRAGVIV